MEAEEIANMDKIQQNTGDTRTNWFVDDFSDDEFCEDDLDKV
jgi:hypothetical protein